MVHAKLQHSTNPHRDHEPPIVLPLPWGEGWGEGEGIVRLPIVHYRVRRVRQLSVHAKAIADSSRPPRLLLERDSSESSALLPQPTSSKNSRLPFLHRGHPSRAQ